MRKTTVGYAVLAAADVALSALAGTPWADRARWLTKPLLMPLLAADVWHRRPRRAAPLEGPESEPDRTTVPLLAGIGLSWVGDVALMFPTPAAFALGLGGFLAAHLSYSWGFIRQGGLAGLRTQPVLAGPALALAGAGAVAVVPFAAGLQVPVAGYVAVIASMAALATGTRGRKAILGAGLFCVSDLVLALGKFRDLPVPPGVVGAIVMATYTAGQYWIARGLQAGPGVGKSADRRPDYPGRP